MPDPDLIDPDLLDPLLLEPDFLDRDLLDPDLLALAFREEDEDEDFVDDLLDVGFFDDALLFDVDLFAADLDDDFLAGLALAVFLLVEFDFDVALDVDFVGDFVDDDFVLLERD